jgi:3-oxoacyl-[acyl-carrier-protein] synthase III
MKQARVIGIGSHLPENILTNADIEKLCDTNDEWIRKRTGIEQRHVISPGQGSSDLALPAAQEALDNAGMSPEEIDIIVFCTVTPDQLVPASASLLQGKLGAVNAAAFDVNAACSGFINGLAVADALLQSGKYANVLLVGAEVQSNRMLWNHRDTAILFADGAGAWVLQGVDPEEGGSAVLTTHLHSDGASHEILHLPRGGSREVFTVDNFDEDAYRIHMNGPELFKRAVTQFVDVCHEALEAAGITMDEVNLFVPHQANKRIIEAAGERMGIDPEKVAITIEKTGNTTAASIPIALHQAHKDGRLKKGDYVLLAAFGAGLTWASAVVRW